MCAKRFFLRHHPPFLPRYKRVLLSDNAYAHMTILPSMSHPTCKNNARTYDKKMKIHMCTRVYPPPGSMIRCIQISFIHTQVHHSKCASYGAA